MTIVPSNLADLDLDDVTQLVEEYTTLLQEAYPDMDLKRGVLQDLLLRPAAALAARQQEALQRYLNARSLQQIEEDPTLADTGVVDDILSNFLVTRSTGSAATGEVTVVVSQATTVTIPSGLVFTANGQEFQADSAFTAKAEASQINSDNDRLLRLLADGNYAFTIEVTAVEEGAEGLLTKDTLLVPALTPKNYVTSYAASDFTDGDVPETNTELLLRLQEGLAAKAPSNRVNMQAMLRTFDGLETVLRTSIVGMSDSEMTRDQHTLFPVSSGGVVDWYIRPQERLLHQALTVTAVLVSVDSDDVGTWQLSLGRDVASGFYELRSIRLPTAENVVGSLTILSETRGLDLTGSGFVPDLDTTAEGTFSRYQTVIAQFTDDVSSHTGLAPGATRDYDVEVVMMPLIDTAQDALNAYDIRSYGADLLVRGAIPCFVQLSFTIQKPSTVADPDVEDIQNALASAVNNVPFIGRLYASNLHDVIHAYLPANTSVSKIDMLGRLWLPTLASHYLRSTEVLVIPTDVHPQVSEKTVQFFLDPEDIAVTIVTSIPIPS